VLPEPTATFHMPTAVPTLLPEQERLLAEILQSRNCVLPCYLGITPGETTLQKARAILETFGGRYRGPFQRTKTDGAFLYSYQFHIGNSNTREKIIYADVTLVSDNNLVQIIEISQSTGRLQVLGQKIFETSLEVYQQYWSRYYTVRQIFLQLGEPQELYLVGNSTFELIISYKDPIAKITIAGSAEENNLCSQYVSVDHISVDLTISNVNSPFEIDGGGGVPLTDREVYLPIEEALGVSPHQFYERVLADPTVCFEPKAANP
jgi:hypothetical protein